MIDMGTMKPEQEQFLRQLAKWQGVASVRDLPPQTRQAENSARQTCKRRGWVTYDGGYWRLTHEGRVALRDLVS
jgi:coproporphyrinogen III oxidase-like Fe-S oxidoreductase